MFFVVDCDISYVLYFLETVGIYSLCSTKQTSSQCLIMMETCPSLCILVEEDILNLDNYYNTSFTITEHPRVNLDL